LVAGGFNSRVFRLPTGAPKLNGAGDAAPWPAHWLAGTIVGRTYPIPPLYRPGKGDQAHWFDLTRSCIGVRAPMHYRASLSNLLLRTRVVKALGLRMYIPQ